MRGGWIDLWGRWHPTLRQAVRADWLALLWIIRGRKGIAP